MRVAVVTLFAVAATAFAADAPPLPPAEAATKFEVADDLAWELVLAEPDITQPVFCNFDERGRLWVVEYRQYPFPAGLKAVSQDDFLRTVYDRVPAAPPNHVKGADRISIHEDTDGNGTYDKHTVFVDGLNICTAIEHGRGGHFVLNPPYLLFYPDANGDDVPDGDPEVLLGGFGIEDTHSVANSLRWGPDGWLYGAHGSTVTSHVTIGGTGKPVADMMGQAIWRYHPVQRKFEVFAEGGGNAFGVEFDSAGRLFSGHNGGDTRGFHYVQGAYLQKGFEKHGPLSNPYAFGYFPPMKHDKVERFTHNFIVYEGGALPEKYEGKLFGVEPLQGRIVLSERIPDGSTFRTRDLGWPLKSTDPWFRPVDIKAGPDGAIYVCDFYERVINHLKSNEHATDVTNGRIYRLRSKESPGTAPKWTRPAGKRIEAGDFASALLSRNKWERQTAQRLFAEADREDLAYVAGIHIRTENPQYQLESLWALARLSDQIALSVLNPQRQPAMARAWAVRLMCEGPLPDASVKKLFDVATKETNVEVRVQLAASAKRLPAAQSLPIVFALLQRDEDARDPRQPLMLWWAIEAKCGSDRDVVVKLLEDTSLWEHPIVRDYILERLMRRFAQSGTRPELLACARLLDLAPAAGHRQKLMTGFEAAFIGRTLAGLPDELSTGIARHGLGSIAFRVRSRDPAATAAALKTLVDEHAKADERLRIAQVLAEVKVDGAVAALLAVIEAARDESLRQASLTALQIYDDASIAERVIAKFNDFPKPTQAVAESLLASRASYALAMVGAVDSSKLKASDIGPETIRKLRAMKEAEIASLVARLWPVRQTPAAQQRIAEVAGILRAGSGDPYAGQPLFTARCSACHKLHGSGGNIGPDLTPLHRDDLDILLQSVVNPSGEIREGYENFLATTKDGRTVSGFLTERDDRIVALRGFDGQTITLDRATLAALTPVGVSLMPEGVLDGLGNQQLRDLFAYLRLSQPLVPRKNR